MSTQSDNMLDAWNRFQEQWLASWSEAVTQTPQHDRPTTSPYAAWQEMLNWSMKAQAEWTRLLLSNAVPKVGGVAPTVQWEEQFSLLMRFWVDAQRQALESWLKMVSDLNAVTSSAEWTDSMKKAMESWRRLSQDMLDSQADLLSSYQQTRQTPRPAARGTKNTKKSPKTAAKDVA